ncbi:hypothetical protein [Methylobacterium oxalidis]|uniref:hypothetical protein n=1 Tax=Methylobacterium oxalidis TaxID=944322 RepID=UPI0033146C60
MRFGVAVFVITVIGAGAAAARETSPERKALQRYCTGALVTFCDGMAPDSPEVQACFEKNMSKLSPGCQKAIKRYNRTRNRG